LKIVWLLLLCSLGCGATLAAPAGAAVTLNFVNADVETVIRAIGEMTGRNFIIDPRVKGTVNIISAQPVSRTLAYQILLSALRLQGFSAVEGKGVVKILPESDAKWHAQFGKSRAADGDRLITQVFTLSHGSAQQLLPVIRPIVSPNNAVTAFPQANALVVTDYADNLRRIAAIVASVDGTAGAQSAVITLLYASAPELVATLNKVLQDSAADGAKTQLSADARANLLLVRADTPGRLAQVRSLVKMLDQPSQAGANVRVVYLKNADAVRVAQTLRALLSSSAAPLSSARRSTLPSAPTATGVASADNEAARSTSAAADLGSSREGEGTVAGPASNLIQADSSSNALIINLPDSMYRNLRNVIEQLDRRRAQVYVETLVMEVSARRLQEMGVQWQSLAGLGQDGTRLVGNSSFSSNTMPGILNQGSSGNGGFTTFSNDGLNIGISRGTLSIPGVGQVLNLSMLARALETAAQGNVLSNPTLMATDNEKARIEVGQEISVQTGQYASSGSGSTVQPFSTYERKKIGFKLEIIPQISEGGSIRMKILQEASALDPGSANSTLPTTNIRAVETSVTVDDGGMIAIGGLIQETVSDNQQKVPLLGDIPWLGWLFKYQYKERKKTNLLVFLKPTIVRDDLGARAIAEERYRYVIGETRRDAAQVLPLDIHSVLEGLPRSIQPQVAVP
jgi:general secretion pathway protein D